jgi:polyisoprenoid-binding protein YceI
MHPAALLALAALAAGPQSYTIDPNHTFPSFEADHMGVSVWRGKLNNSTGKVTLDREAGSGSVEITTDLASIDFGQDALNEWARGKDFFDVEHHPSARFKGALREFVDGRPTRAVGELSLHGVTRPLTLTIDSFRCIPHPLSKRELCGANAYASFDRSAFGLDAGKDYGFKMDVSLRIQVEAVADE